MTEQQSSAVFASHVRELMRSTDTTYKKVFKAEYDLWKKTFTWDALCGIRYGQSFCNYFNISDSILYYITNPTQADKYIKGQYLE